MRKKSRNKKETGRIKRHYRIKKGVSGTKEKPRLNVHRSHKNLYVQLIDDISNTTLLSFSTNDKEFKKDCPRGANIAAAKKIGTYIGTEATKKGIKTVVFDRGGYLYHGRIKALADAAREAGLKF
ncbi:MAG: 50S ribosomal protein L18 [Candidatus Omnitrophota bacterium]|jgi:large subunit ribosomal protein L18|nr:50S ribosomal protein L18 [Candidatus Omnitrophota bacterium]|tara:strand:+ start:185 stop:559 length:375 start_codon:yes stop_codon:yes gene_type:complete